MRGKALKLNVFGSRAKGHERKPLATMESINTNL